MTRGATAYLIGGVLGLVLLAAVKSCSAETYRTLDMFPTGVSVEEVRDIWSSELTEAAIARRPEPIWAFVSLNDAALNESGTCHFYAMATTGRVKGGVVTFDSGDPRFSTLGHELDSTPDSCRRRLLAGFEQSVQRLKDYLEEQQLPSTKNSK